MKTIVSLTLALALVSVARSADKKPFQLSGLYLDTCSCSIPCKCDLLGEAAKGCEGMGVIKITAGSYGGHDLSGVTIAYADHMGSWIRVYVDAPDTARRAAGEEFARAYAAEAGPVEGVQAAKIEVAGSKGAYTVSLDGGAIMRFSTEPVVGGDGTTPLSHANTLIVVSPAVLQGRSAAPSVYHDGGRSIDVPKGRNVYFNDEMQSRGEL
jgi:hypothetical protein